MDGITRKTVIEIAKNQGLEVEENYFRPEFLKDCDEVFLTGTAVEITPVTSIDQNKFTVGDITKLLISEFNKVVKA